MKTYLNILANTVGLPDVFANITPLPQDNGEKFFSDYLFDQILRNEEGKTNKNGECICHKYLSTHSSTHTHVPTTIRHQNQQIVPIAQTTAPINPSINSMPINNAVFPIEALQQTNIPLLPRPSTIATPKMAPIYPSTAMPFNTGNVF